MCLGRMDNFFGRSLGVTFVPLAGAQIHLFDDRHASFRARAFADDNLCGFEVVTSLNQSKRTSFIFQTESIEHERSWLNVLQEESTKTGIGFLERVSRGSLWNGRKTYFCCVSDHVETGDEPQLLCYSSIADYALQRHPEVVTLGESSIRALRDPEEGDESADFMPDLEQEFGFEISDYETDKSTVFVCSSAGDEHDWIACIKSAMMRHTNALCVGDVAPNILESFRPTDTSTRKDSRRSSGLVELIGDLFSEGDDGPSEIQIGEHTARISASVFIDKDTKTRAIESKTFKDWIELVAEEPRIEISRIQVLSVDRSGEDIECITIKATARVRGKEKEETFCLRSSEDVVLVILQHEHRLSTLITRQPRVPVCLSCAAGIPTGKFDQQGNFIGEAATALKMQVGVKINKSDSDLIDMTKLQGDHDKLIFPNTHAFAESTRFYVYRRHTTAQELDDLKAICSIDSSEMLRLEIKPLESLWRTSPDVKALAAFGLYQKYQNTISASNISNRLQPELEALEDEATKVVPTDAFAKLELLHDNIKEAIAELNKKTQATDKECRTVLELFGLSQGVPTTTDELDKQRAKATELFLKLEDFFLKELPRAWQKLDEWKDKAKRKSTLKPAVTAAKIARRLATPQEPHDDP